MRTPNKIYLNPDAATDLAYSPGEDDTKEEYIRKDALLEWCREKANEYKQMDEDFGGDVFLGNRHAFMEMIYKLNEI